MRIKHYTLIVAFLAISMGIPLVQGCSDPFDEYGNGGTEMPVRDGWTSVSMSVEGLGLRNPLTRSLTPEGENSTAAERIRVLVFDKEQQVFIMRPKCSPIFLPVIRLTRKVRVP